MDKKNIMVRVPLDTYEQIKTAFYSTANEHRLSFNAWAVEVLKKGVTK